MEQSRSSKPNFGLYIIVLLTACSAIMGGVFYYSLSHRQQFQAEAGPLMRTRFLQTLIAREGQPFWRIGENTLSLDTETWDFTVKGRTLEVAVRSAIPVEKQASLVSEITNTLRLLLNLEPSSTTVDVQFKNSASYH